MRHRLACTTGNLHELDEYLGYYEIDDEGYISRYVEVRADGTALRYDRTHEADSFGILPEGQWDDAEASKPEYGSLCIISGALFEAVWSNTRFLNALNATTDSSSTPGSCPAP